MALFDEKVSSQLREVLSHLDRRVNILYFTHELECGSCKDTHDFLREIAALSDKLNLTVCDFSRDKLQADYYRIDKIPAIALLDERDEDTRIRYYGIPAGYEINSFVKGLLEVSGRREDLPADVRARIANIGKEIHIQVFISLTCPYCAGMVSAAHRIALENRHVRADMVESSTFQHLAIKYQVSSVPKTIINGTVEIIGAVPLPELLGHIEKA